MVNNKDIPKELLELHIKYPEYEFIAININISKEAKDKIFELVMSGDFLNHK